MTSTPASASDAFGDPAGGAGVDVEGFDDAQTGADVAALVAAVDRLAAAELWRCSEDDLARLVHVSEIASRRLGMVQAAAAVYAQDAGSSPGPGSVQRAPPRTRRCGRSPAGCARW